MCFLDFDLLDFDLLDFDLLDFDLLDFDLLDFDLLGFDLLERHFKCPPLEFDLLLHKRKKHLVCCNVIFSIWSKRPTI